MRRSFRRHTFQEFRGRRARTRSSTRSVRQLLEGQRQLDDRVIFLWRKFSRLLLG